MPLFSFVSYAYDAWRLLVLSSFWHCKPNTWSLLDFAKCGNAYHDFNRHFCLGILIALIALLTGYQQANVVILHKSLADDFEAFCRANSSPLPLLYRSKCGEWSCPPLATGSDIRYQYNETCTCLHLVVVGATDVVILWLDRCSKRVK